MGLFEKKLNAHTLLLSLFPYLIGNRDTHVIKPFEIPDDWIRYCQILTQFFLHDIRINIERQRSFHSQGVLPTIFIVAGPSK